MNILKIYAVMSGRDIERNCETEREVKTRRKREQEEWARHGGYMNAKVQKLINKYDSDKSRENHESQSKLFGNVAIFVNGYTEPSFDVLRNYMIEGGGRFEHYYSATRVTHIVATSLALSKHKLFADKKVVLPSWITDSVKKNSLQPYEKYLLLKRNKITNFFTSRESAPWTGSDVIDPLGKSQRNTRC
ncbi:REV1 [Bugula neritina]|uniref:REV1 n=1 Tax=Bugula neritina TaxID=10212 RepID=A0A7J7J959_BUGNE|nr:REV1 [Bugula neritina]